jgi:hypothetical protein
VKAASQVSTGVLNSPLPEDELAVGDFVAGLHVVAQLLLQELHAETGQPPEAALQRLALLAEARRDTPMAE